MKALFVICILSFVACTPSFFNAHISGPYHHHFAGQVECALVKGWHKEPTCMCLLTKPVDDDRVFMLSKPIFCEQDIEKWSQVK